MDDETAVLLKRLHDERSQRMDEARPEAVAKHHARGQLTARERLALLLDPGSDFDEFGLHARPVSEEYDAPADSVVTGIGMIHGKPYAVASYDYTALGGSQGVIGHSKLARLFLFAEQSRLGIVILSEGGGARVQELGSRYGMGSSDFIILGRLAGRVPIVGAAMGRAFAGHAILLSLCDFVVSTANAAIGMGGPPLVETALGKKFTPEEIGAPEVHERVGGIERLVDDDPAAMEALREYLRLIADPQLPFDPSKDTRDPEQLREVVPSNPKRAYDVRKVIELIADVDSAFELRPKFAANMVTTLARLRGRTVGFLANQPRVLAGAIDADAADKMTRFIRLCDCFAIPIVFLVDTPGFLIGPEAEAQGVMRHQARPIIALSNATVPLVTVTLRKAVGQGYFVMGSRGFMPLATLMWPTADHGGMGHGGAAKLLSASKDATDTSEEEALRRVKDDQGPFRMAERFLVDGLIDPAETRDIVGRLIAHAPSRVQVEGVTPGWVAPLDAW